MNRKIRLFLAFTALIILSLACDMLTSGQLPTSVSDLVSTGAPSDAGGGVPPGPDNNEGGATVNPSDVQEIKIVSQPVFTQHDYVVLVTFMLENPNRDIGIQNMDYKITLSDANGVILATNQGSVNFLLPGERTATYDVLNVTEGQKVDKVEVQLQEGQPRFSKVRAPIFSFEHVKDFYNPEINTDRITGVLKSSLDRDLYNSYTEVVGLAFDDADNFIGGSAIDLTYVPAKSRIGVEIRNSNISGPPSRVELYATVVNFTEFQDKPADNNTLAVTAQGFSIDPLSHFPTGGFVVENKDPHRAIERFKYNVTAYDTEGNVLTANESEVGALMFPGEKTGAAVGMLDLPPGTQASKIEIQAGTEDFYTGDLTAVPLSTENVNYLADPYNPKITGTIRSSLGSTINIVSVTALAYDAAGNIIAAGFDSVSDIPASGSTAFEVSISPNPEGKLAKTEVYLQVSPFSLEP
jgi:hypothetical protein